MKIVKLMVLFLLEMLILFDISNDVNKLGVTLFLILLSLFYKDIKLSLLLILTFLGDYFLAFQQDPIWGIYFFILMQWGYYGIYSYRLIGIGLLFPLPMVMKLVAIYLLLLLANIKKYPHLRTGFLLLLISDLFVGLFNLSGELIYVYLTWGLYVPSLLFLYQNLWSENERYKDINEIRMTTLRE